MGGKQAFRLVGGFQYNATRIGVDKNDDYFAKCRELVTGNRLTEALITGDDKWASKLDIKFRTCFHHALYEALKDFIVVEQTGWRKIKWPRGLSMLRMVDLRDAHSSSLSWPFVVSILAAILLAGCVLFYCCRRPAEDAPAECDMV